MHVNIQSQGIAESIAMAFNLGVWMKQHKDDTADIFETANEMRDIIHQKIYGQYTDLCTEDHINANVEYFLEIALLGYILPGVCLPDEEFKNRLLALIEVKLIDGSTEQPIRQHSAATSLIN